MNEHNIYPLDMVNNTAYSIVDCADPPKSFTNEQKAKAWRARILHNAIGHPSDFTLCECLKQSAINNAGIDPIDIRNATIIYGPCLACQAGKKTTRYPKLSSSEPICR
mmetsp:Transcript_13865/g.12578  ORF Transcript_13865/g.12578 Transcript_13865/m.12578 type:complete len:108 (+) Transcript_13865:183-506(+)